MGRTYVSIRSPDPSIANTFVVDAEEGSGMPDDQLLGRVHCEKLVVIWTTVGARQRLCAKLRRYMRDNVFFLTKKRASTSGVLALQLDGRGTRVASRGQSAMPANLDELRKQFKIMHNIWLMADLCHSG